MLLIWTIYKPFKRNSLDNFLYTLIGNDFIDIFFLKTASQQKWFLTMFLSLYKWFDILLYILIFIHSPYSYRWQYQGCCVRLLRAQMLGEYFRAIKWPTCHKTDAEPIGKYFHQWQKWCLCCSPWLFGLFVRRRDNPV